MSSDKRNSAGMTPFDVPEHVGKVLEQFLAAARAEHQLVVHAPRLTGKTLMLRKLSAALTLEKLAADPNGRAIRKADVAWLVGVTDGGGVVVCGPSRAHGWASAKLRVLRAGAEFWLNVVAEACAAAR